MSKREPSRHGGAAGRLPPPEHVPVTPEEAKAVWARNRDRILPQLRRFPMDMWTAPIFDGIGDEFQVPLAAGPRPIVTGMVRTVTFKLEELRTVGVYRRVVVFGTDPAVIVEPAWRER